LKLVADNTCRLVPSRYPTVGILDRVAAPEDLPFIFELESWTNDRISNELGLLHRIPPAEWVTARPMASVIMAAFCHPRTGGGRFTGEDRGAWYAGTELETAHAEVIYHRGRELAEIGVRETRLEMRLYHADFHGDFEDVRRDASLHDPDSYAVSQSFAGELLRSGANGVLYRSVRRPGGECIACFRPLMVLNVREGLHFEYRWEGSAAPRITTSARARRSSGRPRR
jgi:RES domain-containing protein